MRRTIRILGYGATVVSLLLCVASGVLWVRSYWVVDRVLWVSTREPEYFDSCDSALGVLRLKLPMGYRLSSVYDAGRSAVRADTPLRLSHRQWMDDRTRHGFEWRPIELRDPRTMASTYRYEISVPHGFIVLCTALLPAALLYRWLRRVRKPPGCCAHCGYDLRAMPDRCPECGTIPVTAAPAAPAGGR